MARNGSGTYVLPSGNPVVTGTSITSNWANTTLSDVATALTGSVAADGQTPMTGALQMGNNKVTGLANGTNSTDAATVGQISNPNITGGSIDGTPIGNISPSTGRFTTLNVSAGATLAGTCTAPTVTPGSDNTTKIATTAFVQSAIAAVSSGVTSFNSRTGVVTLSSSDVTTALGYTPYNAGGATVVTTSNISTYAPSPTGSGASGNWGINITGNAATVTNGLYTTGSQTITGVKTFTADIYIGSSANTIFQTGGGLLGLGANLVTGSSATVPATDNSANLGFTSFRWAQVYAVNGTINTSDASAKQQIAEFTPAEIAVGKKLRGLFRTYKMNDAVEKKGANARIHAGVMAQAVFDAFASEGLDANKYSLYCVDTWVDKNGQTQTLCGIRYDELYAFILGSL